MYSPVLSCSKLCTVLCCLVPSCVQFCAVLFQAVYSSVLSCSKLCTVLCCLVPSCVQSCAVFFQAVYSSVLFRSKLCTVLCLTVLRGVLFCAVLFYISRLCTVLCCSVLSCAVFCPVLFEEVYCFVLFCSKLCAVLFCSRLCLSTARSSRMQESSNFHCLLLSLSMSLLFVSQCHLPYKVFFFLQILRPLLNTIPACNHPPTDFHFGGVPSPFPFLFVNVFGYVFHFCSLCKDCLGFCPLI